MFRHDNDWGWMLCALLVPAVVCLLVLMELSK